MSNNQNQISEFLEKLMLLKYKDKFLEDGPHHVENVTEFIRFLSEPNALKEIGMSVFEINRFKRLCKDTIEVWSLASVMNKCCYSHFCDSFDKL